MTGEKQVIIGGTLNSELRNASLQTMRADAIRKERIKQYLRGERKEVFEKNHTPPGSYEPDFFSHVKRTN